MFVINPNEFLVPNFGMSPFKTDYLVSNHLLQDDNYAEFYLNNKFGHDNWIFTKNGKHAIELALNSFQLSSNDLVTIITTSNNFYVSSCVTNVIQKICKWNRELTAETKILLIIHEFGYPYPKMDELKSLGIPIIEDCCTCFFSQDKKNQIGKYGDFSIFSLPKFFPIQIGGILVNNQNNNVRYNDKILSNSELNYILKVLSNEMRKIEGILKTRRENFNYGLEVFTKFGFKEWFNNENDCVPYALLLRNNNIINDLSDLKQFLTKNGIQNSVFYGSDGFFVPNHQSLSFQEIDFIGELVSYFIKNKNL